MLNSELTNKQTIEQLNLAREEIAELQAKIKDMQFMFKSYQRKERKITFNVDILYWQLAFLKHSQEKFGRIITRDNKIVRIESYYER